MNCNSQITANILIKMGFKCSHSGYKYLKELLSLGISGIEILPLNDVGYTYISNIYSKSIESIEKNIENAISYAFMNGNIEYLYDIFGETIDNESGKPTNKQFILTIIDKIINNST